MKECLHGGAGTAARELLVGWRREQQATPLRVPFQPVGTPRLSQLHDGLQVMTPPTTATS